jgi:phosphate transport system permease protein
VPGELREASYALGVPKWRTVLSVVLPTAAAGLATGVMIAVSRVIGETAPLLVAAGITASMNANLFAGPMNSLPLFIYTQYTQQGLPASAFLDRAWAGALTLIIIVIALNLLARLVGRLLAPKAPR